MTNDDSSHSVSGHSASDDTSGLVPPSSEAGTEIPDSSVQILLVQDEALRRHMHDHLARGHWLGTRLTPEGCLFRVWAPNTTQLKVLIEGERTWVQELDLNDDGYFCGCVREATAGHLYRYVRDDGPPLPDPCSRYQPQGPHGPSMIIDPSEYRWQHEWQGIELKGQVLYELHVGTFTDKGTLDAAADKLDYLHALGITAVELMPLAECPGRWNWGYDGVCLFAPSHNYGDYAALQRFVDRAHGLGIGVILDVVYNHLGPDGNYLPMYSPYYFSKLHKTEWGDPLNFDGEHSAKVREFIIENACEWIREFRLDGLRLDATQSIFDVAGERHILAELSHRVRATAGSRRVLLISENEPQHATQLLPVAQGGFDFDALWNDDFHHAAMVAATGRRHAYYLDYLGAPQEFVSSAKRGFLFQGQYYLWQSQTRGEPLQSALRCCIHFLQNHDQVANSLGGARLHQLTSAARWRALTALLLLGPQTPLLFMGQEFAASSPFLFFADHTAPLNEAVHRGRKEFLAQFPGASSAEGQQSVADPAQESTMQRSKLDWSELNEHTEALSLHVDLLELRRNDPVIALQGESGIDGGVLAEHAFVLRWFHAEHGDRLLVVNLGIEVQRRPMPEPLLAPPLRHQWVLLWSSEHIRYGGLGLEMPVSERGWHLPGESAVLLKAVPISSQTTA